MKNFILYALLLVTNLCNAQYMDNPLPATKPYKQVYGYVSYSPIAFKRVPLLVALGGYGQNPGNGRSDLHKVLTDGIGELIKSNRWTQDSFIVVLPQSGSKEYNPKTLHAFIEYIKTAHNVDTTRIYITGLSGGANSLYKYLALYRCTAALPVAGAGDYKTVCTNHTTETPILAFHGGLDTTVKPGPEILLISKYNACTQGELATLTTYPTKGHNVWDITYTNPYVYAWLLSHKN